jgi:hypothetical protein
MQTMSHETKYRDDEIWNICRNNRNKYVWVKMSVNNSEPMALRFNIYFQRVLMFILGGWSNNNYNLES